MKTVDLLVDLLFAVDSVFLKGVFLKVFNPIFLFIFSLPLPTQPTNPVTFNFLYALVTP